MSIENIPPTEVKRQVLLGESTLLHNGRPIIVILPPDNIFTLNEMERMTIEVDDWQYPVIALLDNRGNIEIDLSRIGPERVYDDIFEAINDINNVLQANNIKAKNYIGVEFIL